MAKYRLGVKADNDLAKHFDYGCETFGIDQAENYLFGLHNRFEDLADNPALGRSAEQLAPNLRRLTIWTLTGARYSLDKMAICNVIRCLIGDSGFVFEDIQTVWTSLRDYQASEAIQGKSLDFADALIVNKAHVVAVTHGVELSGFYSFIE